MNDFINGYFTTSAAKITTADYACCVKKTNSEIRTSEIKVATGGISCFLGMLEGGNLAGTPDGMFPKFL